MRPLQLVLAAQEISRHWPDALIYVNPPSAENGYVRNSGIPENVLAVDVDHVWPHKCDIDDDDCTKCYGWYELVAWIDMFNGEVHWTSLGAAGIVLS